MKKIIDERQAIEQLKVLKTGFWTMWTILLVSIVYHAFFLQTISWGELIAFFAGCAVETIGGAKIGVWDSYLKPNAKSYFIVGSAAAVFVIVLSVVSGFQRVPLALTIMGVQSFIVAYVISWLLGSYAKKQSEKDIRE